LEALRNTHRISLVLAAIGLVAALLVAACGGDDNSKSTPTTAAGATISQVAGSPSAPATNTAAYPVTVTDLLGRSVTIKSKPMTIVALSPTAVEFVYAAGGTVVGRTDTVDYPPAAKSATDIGSAYQPSMEKVLSLKPDLIVADSIIDAQPQLMSAITATGIPTIFAGVDSYQKVLDGLTLMGKVLDNSSATNAVAANVTKARDNAKAALAGKNISALAITADQDQVLYGAKTDSYAGDILAQLGISNPASTLPDSGPFPGYTTLAQEKIIEFNPDYIFTVTPAPPPVPRLSTTIPQIPAFANLKAVQNHHVFEAPVELIEAPGPRIIDAFNAITSAILGANSSTASPAASSTTH
jgi:iron complex transport system substrate-binding protein